MSDLWYFGSSLLEGGLELGGRRRECHIAFILLDLHELLVGNVILHWIAVCLLKSDLILLVNFLLQIFGLMLVNKVVIGVSEVHKQEEDHDTGHGDGIEGDEELLILSDGVVEGECASDKEGDGGGEDGDDADE
jgi:hypothetical protein